MSTDEYDNTTTPDATTAAADYQGSVQGAFFGAIKTNRDAFLEQATQLEEGKTAPHHSDVDAGIKVVLDTLDQLKATVHIHHSNAVADVSPKDGYSAAYFEVINT